MMLEPTHLDTELIQRFIHGELSEDQRAQLSSHVASCADCAGLVEAAIAEEEEVFGLIEALSSTTPSTTATTIMARGKPRAGLRWGRWAAAALLMLVGVGAAYAAPGSPLPEWLGGAFGGGPGAVEPPVLEPVPGEEPGSGIMVDLAGDWTIEFPDPPASGMLIVTVEDGPNISIRSSDVGSSFDWDVARVTVRQGDAAAANFTINVPPDAASVRIVVRERTVWRRSEGESITTSMSEVEEGVYRLQLDQLPG